MKTQNKNIMKQCLPIFMVFSLLLATTLACSLGSTPSPTSTPAPTPTVDVNAPGQVKGVLLDATTSQPLANVTVGLLLPGKKGQITYIEQTDFKSDTNSTGAFLLDLVPPGEYLIYALVGGYQNPVTDNSGKSLFFEVRPGQTIDLGSIEVKQ